MGRTEILSNSHFHRIAVWKRQWDEITTLVISHNRRESWRLPTAALFHEGIFRLRCKNTRSLAYMTTWKPVQLQLVICINFSRRDPEIEESIFFPPRWNCDFCQLVCVVGQVSKTWEGMKWTSEILYLLVSEGVKWKTSSTYTNSVRACVCVLCRLWGSCVCLCSMRRECWGETTYTSTCSAF